MLGLPPGSIKARVYQSYSPRSSVLDARALDHGDPPKTKISKRKKVKEKKENKESEENMEEKLLPCSDRHCICHELSMSMG